jgi:hypothetical protein
MSDVTHGMPWIFPYDDDDFSDYNDYDFSEFYIIDGGFQEWGSEMKFVDLRHFVTVPYSVTLLHVTVQVNM